MYITFLTIHNILRWLLLASMLYTLFTSIEGLWNKRSYSQMDNISRVLTNIISHTQLIIGLTLYFVLSPITKFFIQNGSQGSEQMTFFALKHSIMMVLAVVAMTIGGSVAKRAATDVKKFRSIAVWFTIALILVLSAIPWFRPFFRHF